MRRLTRHANIAQKHPEKTEERVGATLAMVRKGQGLSLEEVGKELNIHAHQLEALEQGHLDAFPNPFWARGLLIRYADHLSLDGEQLAERAFPRRAPAGPARYLPRRRWTWIVALGAILVLAAVVATSLLRSEEDGIAGKIKDSLHAIAPGMVLAGEPQRVVVLGRDGAGITGSGNIMTLEVSEDGYSVWSIPEGRPAEVPGRGKRSVGEVAALGGPDLTRRMVSQLTSAKVQHYLMIGPEGIKEITDEIGGVRVNVPNPIVGRASVDGPEIELRPGTQTLDGDEVLVYLQGQDLSSDAELVSRQQELLLAMFEQALGPGQLLSNPPTVSTLLGQTETNITAMEAVQLATRLESLKGSDAAKDATVEPAPEEKSES